MKKTKKIIMGACSIGVGLVSIPIVATATSCSGSIKWDNGDSGQYNNKEFYNSYSTCLNKTFGKMYTFKVKFKGDISDIRWSLSNFRMNDASLASCDWITSGTESETRLDSDWNISKCFLGLDGTDPSFSQGIFKFDITVTNYFDDSVLDMKNIIWEIGE